MSSQTRNIVIFGSERGKTPFQTREVNEKKEKEEKKEADRVWERKNGSSRPEILWIPGLGEKKRSSRPEKGTKSRKRQWKRETRIQTAESRK